MSYISEIFDRPDIQHIREFLLHGVECVEINDRTYKQRIDAARTPAIDLIRKKFPIEEECKEITSEVYHYASATEDAYMEIGKRCGANLVYQLLFHTVKGRGDNG